MKKRLTVILCCMVLCGCSNGGVSKEEYESVVAEAEVYSSEAAEYSSEAAARSSEVEELNNRISDLEKEKESISNDYNAYKESMSEYEALAAAEVEARRIEAERIAEEERAEKERQEAESLAAKEAEEKAGYETGITYEQLARTPDDYMSKKIKFKGKVIQLIEGDTANQIRFAVNSNYDQILFCEYEKSIVPTRVLEDDIITIYGTSYGLYSYQSTMGGQITIPSAVIDKIEQ